MQWHNHLSLQPQTPGLKQSSQLSLPRSWDYSTDARHYTQLIFVCLVEIGFYHVGQAGLKFLASWDPRMLAPQSTEITGVCHHTWPFLLLYFCLFFRDVISLCLPGWSAVAWA